MYLQNGKILYSCSVLDLYDRSIIGYAKWQSNHCGACDKPLKTALHKVGKINNEIIIHIDQGRQDASKDFTEFCSSNNLVQSMSKAGCPYTMLLRKCILIPLRMSF